MDNLQKKRALLLKGKARYIRLPVRLTLLYFTPGSRFSKINGFDLL